MWTKIKEGGISNESFKVRLCAVRRQKTNLEMIAQVNSSCALLVRRFWIWKKRNWLGSGVLVLLKQQFPKYWFSPNAARLTERDWLIFFAVSPIFSESNLRILCWLQVWMCLSQTFSDAKCPSPPDLACYVFNEAIRAFIYYGPNSYLQLVGRVWLSSARREKFLHQNILSMQKIRKCWRWT